MNFTFIFSDFSLIFDINQNNYFKNKNYNSIFTMNFNFQGKNWSKKSKG